MIEPFIKSLPPFLVGFLVILIWSNHKWKRSKKILQSIEEEDFEIFRNLDISTKRSVRWKDIWGFTIKADLYLGDLEVIVLPSKRTWLLFHTALPNVFLKNTVHEINIRRMDEISIKASRRNFYSAKETTEIIIETENRDQKKVLMNALKKWKPSLMAGKPA